MTRRSPPSRQTDDLRFPVRVRVAVPWNGFATLLPAMQDWLDRELGPGAYAQHGGRSAAAPVSVFYFRDTRAADRFVAAFGLVLADGLGRPVAAGGTGAADADAGPARHAVAARTVSPAPRCSSDTGDDVKRG